MLKGNNAIDRLIARFSPSMPKKGHNRIVVARLTGNENFFDRFIKRMEKLDAGDIWAMIIDITQIDTRNRRKLHDDLPRFTDYNTERKLPSSIRFSLEQAIDFINQERKRGQPVREAVIEAGKKRFRPIIMTSLTTILALVRFLTHRSTFLDIRYENPKKIGISHQPPMSVEAN